jgi:hypothetical protein
VYSETFKDITADSFTQVLQEGDPGQPLQNTATISARRKSEPAMIAARSMDDSSSNAEAELRAFMNQLKRQTFRAMWTLSLTPSLMITFRRISMAIGRTKPHGSTSISSR